MLQHGNIACCIPMKKSHQWAAGRKTAFLPPPQLLSFGHAGPCGREAGGTMAPVEGTAEQTHCQRRWEGSQQEGKEYERGDKLWLKQGACLCGQQAQSHASGVL